MKNIAAGLALMVMSGCALAKWVEVFRSTDGVVMYYVDDATTHKVGASVKVWTLVDFQEAQVISEGQNYLSVKMQEEVHCSDQKSRHLNVAAFAENMGAGKLVGSEKGPAQWRAVSNDSMVDGIVQFVCRKK